LAPDAGQEPEPDAGAVLVLVLVLVELVRDVGRCR
jgi:hypothetical protein